MPNFHQDSNDIPENNVLDLRTPKAAEPETRRARKKHVDFLTFVEEGESKLEKATRSWFQRKAKTVESPSLTAQVPSINHEAVEEVDLPPAEPKQQRIRWRIPVGPTVRFGVGLAALVAVIVGARFVTRVQDVRGDVLGASTQAVQELLAAGNAAGALQFGTSQKNLEAAADAFQSAQADIEEVAGFVRSIPGTDRIQRAQNLLAAGEAMASAAQLLAKGAEQVSSAGTGGPAVVGVLAAFDTSVEPAAKKLGEAATLLQTVKASDLPTEYQAAFADLQEQLPSMQVQFERLHQVGAFLRWFLGADGTPKRFLFTFQDTNELRPTGGFIGSVAIVEMADGVITKVEVPSGGVYDLSGQTNLKVQAPQPLRLVMANWNLQDANWFPDFPTSAKKMLEFYTSAGRTSVDGVVAITPAVLQSFLALTGPVEVKEFKETFTAENFPRKLQEIIKASEAKDYTKPKLVLGYLAPQILGRAFSLEQSQLWQLLGTLQDHVTRKDLQFYATNSTKQTLIQDIGWSGTVRQTESDFLMVNRANIGGGKTDGVVETLVRHEANIAASGAITNTVTVILKHTGVPRDQFTGARNVSYVRVYVPGGSTFVSATGFEQIDPKRFQMPSADRQVDADLSRLDVGALVDDASGTRISTEFGKTAFGNWLGVAPGETIEARITYTLPFTLKVGGLLDRADQYSLLAQMQPGTKISLASTLSVPADWNVSWEGSTASAFTRQGNMVRMNTLLERDQYYGVVVRK
ncbi:MAG: DUF4012 domain-containing protein [Patescibacteria group bacterium]